MNKKIEIKIYPDPILREKCKPVEKITHEIEKLITQMKKAMKEYNGIGLAAPQIGESKRIIVIETEKQPVAFLNPKIINQSKEKQVFEEGCLSFPGLWLKIKRPKRVEIEALNEKGKKIKIEAEGLLAQVFQHEIDHLNGVLFIDRASIFQKLKLKKLKKFLKSYNL